MARRRSEGIPGVFRATATQPARAMGGAQRAKVVGRGTSVRRVRESFVRGVRLGIPYAVVAFVLSMSFGVVARQAGFSALQAVAASALIFAGSAQFAALAVVAGGGTLAAAVAAATLMNGRFLAMGIALAPSLPGGPVTRAIQGQTVVDASWALANNGDGTFDRWLLFGTTLPQYVAWVLGTVAGAYGGDLIGDPERLGLDAVFPTFFLGLLLAEMRDRRSRAVAVVGAVIALALVPITPPGVPVLAAAIAALLGAPRRGDS
jgi:4-azaleucine resistance transporter AzlC